MPPLGTHNYIYYGLHSKCSLHNGAALFFPLQLVLTVCFFYQLVQVLTCTHSGRHLQLSLVAIFMPTSTFTYVQWACTTQWPSVRKHHV